MTEFKSLTQNLHHLLSTSAIPGVYNGDQVSIIGRKRAFYKPLTIPNRYLVSVDNNRHQRLITSQLKPI